MNVCTYVCMNVRTTMCMYHDGCMYTCMLPQELRVNNPNEMYAYTVFKYVR